MGGQHLAGCGVQHEESDIAPQARIVPAPLHEAVDARARGRDLVGVRALRARYRGRCHQGAGREQA